eukprot:141638-Hanusia_phi.AAC.1
MSRPCSIFSAAFHQIFQHPILIKLTYAVWGGSFNGLLMTPGTLAMVLMGQFQISNLHTSSDSYLIAKGEMDLLHKR